MDDIDRQPPGEERPPDDDRPGAPPRAPDSQEGDIPAAQEASFLNKRTLLLATAGLVGMIVFVLLLAGGLFWAFARLETPEPAGATAPALNPVTPPGPRLQVNPGQDVQQARAREQQHLEGYTWVDRQNGVVRIPIERAMQLIVERGLPTRITTPGPPSADGPDNSGFGFATPAP